RHAIQVVLGVVRPRRAEIVASFLLRVRADPENDAAEVVSRLRLNLLANSRCGRGHRSRLWGRAISDKGQVLRYWTAAGRLPVRDQRHAVEVCEPAAARLSRLVADGVGRCRKPRVDSLLLLWCEVIPVLED